MNRRRFATLAGGAIAAWPLAVRAQQSGKVFRVALIATTTPVAEMVGPEPMNPLLRAFLRGMRAHGYEEGRNFIFERRSAKGRPERFAEILRELIALRVDAIVTVSNLMAQQAKETTATIPIVMALSADPVEAGLVQSLARPGGNVTGLTGMIGPEFEAKRLELLKQAVPSIARVAWLGLGADWESPRARSARAAAGLLDISLIRADHTWNSHDEAFSVIVRERADAIFAMDNTPNADRRRLIIDFATERRLPAIFPFRASVEAGGLLSYGVDLPDQFRRAATYVDNILKGAKPADLPIEQPTKFELVVNLKTAKALGLVIPTSILVQADEVIE